MGAETLQRGQGPGKPKDGWVLFNHKCVYVSTFEYWKGEGKKKKRKARQTKKHTHTSLYFAV